MVKLVETLIKCTAFTSLVGNESVVWVCAAPELAQTIIRVTNLNNTVRWQLEQDLAA